MDGAFFFDSSALLLSSQLPISMFEDDENCESP